MDSNEYYKHTFYIHRLKQHFELAIKDSKRHLVYVVSVKMTIFNCPMDGCPFRTDDVEASVAAVMLTIYNNVHLASQGSSDIAAHQRAPKIKRPKISTGSSEETWNTFSTRWNMFKEAQDSQMLSP